MIKCNVTLKNKYNQEIVKMMDQLVSLGARLSDCKHINEKLTSSEYKQICIDNVNKEIDDIKQKLMYSIISLADSSKLNIPFQ